MPYQRTGTRLLMPWLAVWLLMAAGCAQDKSTPPLFTRLDSDRTGLRFSNRDRKSVV